MTVERLAAGEQGQGYYVTFEATLQAPPGKVMDVLQDYPGYPDLDPRIIEARVEVTGPGQRLLYTTLRGCVGSVFCRDMRRVERLTETDRLLVADAVAGRGDLVQGRAETRVEPEGEGSRVTYRSDFEPSFWMPRWLVRSAMQHTLEDGTRRMFENVERKAREGQRP
jgi:carbon monoxide dehydrogenase subunit G